MKKKQITIENLTWVLFIEDTGWVIVKKFQNGELSRTQFRAMNICAALQYVWTYYNKPSMKPLIEEDLTEWEG